MASAGISRGPTPWWQLPEYRGSRSNLESSAPSGYEYDPVQMRYVRTPTSAGQRVNQFSSAALGGLREAASGSGVFGSMDVSGGGGVGGGTAGGPGGGGAGYPAAGSRIESIAPIDMTAANAAIYGRAKDVAGQTGRASIDTLRGVLGETGQLGGGAEAQGVRDIVESAAGQVGDVNREIAIQNARQGLDVARTNQAAGITQRGQDIQAQEAAARLAQQQANIMFQQQMAKSQQQLDLLRLVLGQSRDKSFLY